MLAVVLEITLVSVVVVVVVAVVVVVISVQVEDLVRGLTAARGQGVATAGIGKVIGMGAERRIPGADLRRKRHARFPAPGVCFALIMGSLGGLGGAPSLDLNSEKDWVNDLGWGVVATILAFESPKCARIGDVINGVRWMGV